MKYADIGTVSHGTMRDEDLIPTFVAELKKHMTANSPYEMGFHCHREYMSDLIKDAEAVTDFLSEEASDIMQELFEALETFAPPYCYFGAIEGDGSDYGYWPAIHAVEAEIEDGNMHKVSDLSEIDNLDLEVTREVAIVNDHGNLTVGYVDDKGEFVTYWSVV